MSRPKLSRVASWLFAALLIVGSMWVWQSRQWIVDAVSYSQYTPTSEVKQIANDARLTEDGRFMFYASHPAVQSSKQFNENCLRKEADSPILGCYAARQIFIYDVTDERLDGIETVTAAHELLHAVFERLTAEEKNRLESLLEKAYRDVANDKLEERLTYYERTEPGQRLNELHSIIGTEYATIGSELEEYYGRYFSNRQAIVTMHTEVERVFESLSQEAANLVARIDTIVASINTATAAYNEGIMQLNADVAAFNARANRPGGFTTQEEFEVALAELNSRRSQMEVARQAIEADILTYKTLLARLDAINAESANLNKSIDSNLEDVPAI